MPARPLLLAAAACALLAAAPARAADAPAPAGAAARPLPALKPAPAAASGASGRLDVEAATRAYLDELSPAAKARSDAYFEGGYWLQLWGFLWSAAVYGVLLFTGLSARMMGVARRATRFTWLQPAAYWVQFMLVTTLVGFPLSVYQEWWRERQYGLSNLDLAGWLGEQGKGLLVGAVAGSLAVVGVYAVLRRARRSWWLWGAAVTLAFATFGAVVAPVALVPIFNSPKRLADQRVTGPILALARANGIATGEVWEIDASRQTSRVSANVSGLLGTERITLNDNLLARSSLPEIEAVMAHEMGHYVLNHVYKGLLELGLVIVLGFWVVSVFFERLRARFEARWGVAAIGDPAGLPLALLLLSTFLFLMTPVLNTIVRVSEQEADAFGLNAARQPDGFARAALMLSEYRKMEPSPLEELVFYDHPSGRTRILTAMRWKAENPGSWPVAMPPAAPPVTPPVPASP